MFSFCFQICLMRFFWSVKVSYACGLAKDRYAGPPFVLKPNHPHETRFVSFVWPANILRISRFVNKSQILQSVVRFVAVNVVNKSARPFSIRKKPCQAMRFIDSFFDSYSDVSLIVNATGNIANLNASGGSRNPSQVPSVGVIKQYLSDIFGGKIGVVHLGSPVTSLNINTGITK